MNKDLLIDAMGLIPDDMLQEAEEYQGDLEMAVNENEVKKIFPRTVIAKDRELKELKFDE